ncbi:hypothetical protein AB0365_02815, partial [Brevibacterium casei]|uniref:hypothetical protein n=1 Tax=Brevibacterium casei TaxID=33889 RepID=UPI00344C0889
EFVITTAIAQYDLDTVEGRLATHNRPAHLSVRGAVVRAVRSGPRVISACRSPCSGP